MSVAELHLCDFIKQEQGFVADSPVGVARVVYWQADVATDRLLAGLAAREWNGLTGGWLPGRCTVYVTSSSQANAADHLGHQLAMRLRGAYAHLRRRSNLAFASFGLSADQYVLLTVLVEHGQSTQQDLVRRCYSDTATIGAMVSLLEEDGLVTRTPHPRDGRAVSVALTREGRGLAEKMRRRSSSLRARMAALFTEEELRTLIASLDRLAGAMHPPGRRPRATPVTNRRGSSRPSPRRSARRNRT